MGRRRQKVAGWEVRKVIRQDEVIRSVIQKNVQSQAGRLPRRVDSIATLTMFLPIQLSCRLLYCKILLKQD